MNMHYPWRSMSSDDGASAVEYALLVVAIAAVIVALVFALGGLVRSSYEDACSRIDSGVTTIDQADC